MIHYHGTPISGSRVDSARFLVGRHSLVSYAYPDDLAIVADVCQSFILDNGAFTAWKQGKQIKQKEYIQWVREWYQHPGFDWALIPDIIEGDEKDNDDIIEDWRQTDIALCGVPVWHLHESVDRLKRLAKEWRIVALGSSGTWATPGTKSWWKRIDEALKAICIDGKPVCKLHGLRMLSPDIFKHMPLSSADSTNAGVNAGSLSRFGMYLPPTAAQRAEVIAERIESVNSAPIWVGHTQESLF